MHLIIPNINIIQIIIIILFNNKKLLSCTYCTTSGLSLNSNGFFSNDEIAWCLALD